MTILQPTRVDPIKDADPNDLVVRARAGCDQSFTELATRFFPRLVQLVLPRIASNSHMDAEDIAQDALARAFQNLAAFNPRYRFSTWLYTIALRLATDHNRGQRRRLSLLETHRTLLELDASEQVTTGAECERRDSVDAIWRMARAVLGESQFTAMWLRFAEDLSVEEIARVMCKTSVGVRVLLHRARIKMLRELNKEDAFRSQENSRESV